MTTTTTDRAALVARLTARRDELATLLDAAAAEAGEARERAADVRDFKDLAADEDRAALDDAALARAQHDMAEVAGALERVRDGTYGLCAACGETIDPRRLQALPAAPLCAACQGSAERADAHAHGH